MWVVMILQDFEFEPVNFPFPITFIKGKLKGFLPVYETLEDAENEFPNSKYVEIVNARKEAK